jgi:Zn-dependent hydrolases, including glyoxylases
MILMSKEIGTIREIYTGPPEFPEFMTSYIISDEKVAIIDPGPNNSIADYSALISKLDYIILTNVDIERAGAINTLLSRFPTSELIVYKGGRELLENPKEINELALRKLGNIGNILGSIFPVKGKINEVEEGDEIVLGFRRLRIIHTPGVSKISMSIDMNKIVFTGSSIGCRLNGVVFPSLYYEFDYNRLMKTIEKLLRLKPIVIALYQAGLTNAKHLNEFYEFISNISTMSYGKKIEELLSTGIVNDFLNEYLEISFKLINLFH